MLYRADRVPVGEDQKQHLELTRDLAERFNSRFGASFKVPERVFPEVGGRMMDLQEPTRKMSTTGGTAQGTVWVLDEPDTIRKKFRSAVTDSGSEVRRAPRQARCDQPDRHPLLAHGRGRPMRSSRGTTGAGYGQFKTDIGDAVVEAVAPVQERYRELRADPVELQRLLARGAEKARKASEPTLEAMFDRMGCQERGGGGSSEPLGRRRFSHS